MNKRKLILRADGNSKIGLGHVYRLLALADILQGMFDCSFAISNPDPFIKKEIEKRNCACLFVNNNHEQKLPDENKAGEEIPFDLAEYLLGNEIVVTDGYLFGKNYQLAVKVTGAKLVCIDDIAAWEFFADVVINHAPGISAAAYKRQSYTQVFTGLEYAIIRKPFFRPLPKKLPRASNKAFICLGGADYYGISLKFIELLHTFDQFTGFHIVCSSSFSEPLINSLKQWESATNKVSLHFNLSAEEMVDVMDDCTYAFVAASTVLMESYARGLTCFAGHYVNNQKFIYEGFVQNKWAIALGDLQLLTPERLSAAISELSNINNQPGAFVSEQKLRAIFNSLAQ